MLVTLLIAGLETRNGRLQRMPISKTKTLVSSGDFPDSIRKARLAWVAETLRNFISDMPFKQITTRNIGIITKFGGKDKQ
jgi:hypothetical protein